MKCFWTQPFRLAELDQLDAKLCRLVIARCHSVADLRNYLENVLLRLERREAAIVREAWSVAIPLAYRLALDDTSRGYRIGSRLKEAALWAAYPQLMECVELEVDWLCKSAYNVTYAALGTAQEKIHAQLTEFQARLEGDWRVYGRRKSIGSIFEKLFRYHSGEKTPKNDSSPGLNRMALFLAQFEGQVAQRLSGEHRGKREYDHSEVKWLLPDLLAFTLQLKESGHELRNLGSAKAKYKAAFAVLRQHFAGCAYFGPSYSSAWHMNRMVCHWEYPVGESAPPIALELFVRTDFDFFVGYGSYWRYKGVDLFAASNEEGASARRRFVSRIRACKSFSDVQEMLFTEITTGQLSLF